MTATYDRAHPMRALLKNKRRLSGLGSQKEIVHLEIALPEEAPDYAPGAVLHILPHNQPELVAELCALLTPAEKVWFAGEERDFLTLLQQELEIRTPGSAFFDALLEKTADAELHRLFASAPLAEFNAFMAGKDIVDLLSAYPEAHFSAQELVACLRPLASRRYSIASSARLHPAEVHLTVGRVRYQQQGRWHHGVGSTYLTELPIGAPLCCYLEAKPDFALPPDEAALIMVGPGTGIAPFRAFLEERQARGAQGKNWLFFGDRHRSEDFLYREELEAWQQSGLLTHLDLAFSRDQEQKIYVQQRMQERGAELWQWLAAGGSFLVCGDAARMAKDVERSLTEIVAEHGKMPPAQAADYISALKKEKRYLRDVY